MIDLAAGGLIIAVTDLNTSERFYCELLEAEVLASDGTTSMIGSSEGDPWLLALRQVRGHALHPSSTAVGIRAVFFRVDLADLEEVEARLRRLGAFRERHSGEFYEMVSALSPDRNALGFWSVLPDAPAERASFVPPSIYLFDQ